VEYIQNLIQRKNYIEAIQGIRIFKVYNSFDRRFLSNHLIDKCSTNENARKTIFEIIENLINEDPKIDDDEFIKVYLFLYCKLNS